MQHIGIRQILAPAAALVLIAGGIIMRPSEQTVEPNIFTRANQAVAGFLCPPEELENVVVTDFAFPLSLVQDSGNNVTFDTGVQMLAKSGDDGVYTLTIKDGKVSAKVNGKDLPKNQIKKDGDTYTLYNSDGKQIGMFNTAGKSGYSVLGEPRTMQLRSIQPGQSPLAGNLQLPSGQPGPKVMIGITMSDAPKEILQGIVIDRVLEDLPASKAGIEVGDIIIEIKGADGGVSQEVLRGILREKSPGDKINLKVLRDGAIQDLVVSLDAYNPQKLGVTVESGVTFEAPDVPFGKYEFVAPQGSWFANQDDESVKEALEHAMKSLKDVDPQLYSEEARKALESAMKKSAQWRNEHDFTVRVNPELTWRLFTDEDGRQFNMPKAMPQNAWQTDDRTQDLENRLKRLEDKIARLEKAIEKLTADR